MFQSYKYGLLTTLRSKSQIFWTMLFPIILGTLFNIAFGSIIENTENFSQLPVAIVTDSENQANAFFLDMVEQLSEGEDALISPQYVEMEKAVQLLNQEEIDGIFFAGDEISLTVSKNGLNQNVLKTISDSFLQTAITIGSISDKKPEKIEQIIRDIYGSVGVNHEISLGKGETDTFIHYYYSLLAMACLFGSSFGLQKIRGIQADLSPLAARRCVSPSKKASMILSDLAAAFTIHFTTIMITIAYLIFALGVNFGDQWGFVILTCFAGSFIGISYGAFVSSFSKAEKNATDGFLTGSSLIMCFFSGLMIGNMKDIIERHLPVINRINPATLLADAFYCLSVYNGYARYTRNIISLLIISTIFCALSALALRRKQYASM